jgi:stage II sporulation protein D
MKFAGKAVTALLLAALMMLLPLGALPRGQAESPTDTSAPTADTPPADQTTNTLTDETTYRMLCGDTVVALPRREFLIRTLAMEMPALYHEEALKAQAVAAYTYYERRRLQQAEKADPTLQGADFVTPNAAFPQEYTAEKLQARWGEQY